MTSVTPAWVYARALTRAQKRAVLTGYALSEKTAASLGPLGILETYSTWPGLSGARIDKLTALGVEVKAFLETMRARHTMEGLS